ncbi:hypothetical protein [Plantactinospora soyae]|uniref:Uncharacterized protein n=1 Tax=Plantactinospora soyae TaxID=1544732 RepID=A0A927MFV0_9ACTN|nr:hypothetical protein [Plantactinospora soyae]MBE1492281.1 hypothetical protein [Plantactinospora soyae]
MTNSPWKRELRERCEATFDFLVSEHDCRKRGRFISQGIEVFYWNATTGVSVSAVYRDPFSVDLCVLPEDGFPPRKDEYGARLRIDWFDAFYVVTLVTGKRPKFSQEQVYGNDQAVLDAYADALRGPCRPLLHDAEDPLWARLGRQH